MVPQLVRALHIAHGKKAATIATSPAHVESNFAHIIWEFEAREYTKNRYLRHLQKLYHTVRRLRPWNEVMTLCPWQVLVLVNVLDPITQQSTLNLASVAPTGQLLHAWHDCTPTSLKEAIHA